jgi:glycosyltransferase involved in cell wall biosynthesis
VPSISAIVPALDEEGAIEGVVRDLLSVERSPGVRVLRQLIVADNGSRDRTAERARLAGANVVLEPQRGYGAACLAGIARLRELGPPDIVVFADGDGSNDARDLPALVRPIEQGDAELVIGSRAKYAEPGSLTVPQRFGNILASRMLRYFYGASYTDLGPFRAVTWSALEAIGMTDRDYGWTVEMQIKAVKLGIRVQEVCVQNRARAFGHSKIGGTVRGVIGASQKIIRTILKYR